MSYYNWTGGNGALSPAVNNAGNGEPKAYTGLVGTHHRPSDDLSTFGRNLDATSMEYISLNYPIPAFLTPANAMLSVELTNLADILDSAKLAKNMSAFAREYSARIQAAIWDTTVSSEIFEAMTPIKLPYA